MSRLLVVHHTPSPTCQELLEAVLEGARTDELPGTVDVVTRPALTAGPADVLAADGVVLGTPANIGTMSGALKHFFDQIYYPVMQDAAGLGFGLYVHGGDDTAGAVRDVLRITGGLGWEQAAEVVTTTGALAAVDREAAWELGATLALRALGGE
ncbi:flavodoxin family protein [Actinomycetospora termitidis]|uniref:NAD(P)H-dependent oxidoreductase n=1 Tax=Actinomycetospora termitidis TaxID=3053470 RepID=A0ABT7MHY6_9PSEU|nr:NAD(P)H-dependent oxidoreductase [Actinomycetospora sp. Odt1-22]MDL5160296.1 NAD(P)H-dependent oxidoreductase [Actinomycetospora sp. Odt1-22]